ncbi:MAG: hypothetical protein PHV33_10945 [Elusimicrobiales bacterium]|nr:hypothetical protein [Elusimicrobiales bacterium]
MTAGTPYLRIAFLAAFRACLLGAALFVPGGSFRWTAGWAYLGTYAAWSCANIILLGRRQPALLRLRETEAPPAAEAWDKAFITVSTALLGATVLICGLEGPASAFGPVSAAAFAAILAALAAFSWALLSNPFAAGAAVLQPGQTPADKGPYRAVRHPVYLASIVISAATPAALGSRSAWLPAGLLALAIAARAAMEDRLLLRGLPGYKEYAARVPYRLLPGIW